MNNATANTTGGINLPLGSTIELAIFIILAENLSILLTIRLLKTLKVVDLLILSLALSDFVNALLPLQVINIKAHFVISAWPKWLCSVFVWSTYTLRISSLATVSLMSIEKAILLFYPLRYYTQITLTLTRKLIVIAWVFSAIVATFVAALKKEQTKSAEIYCYYQPYQFGLGFGVFVETIGMLHFAIVLGSYLAMLVSSKHFRRRQKLMLLSQKKGKNRHIEANQGQVVDNCRHTVGNNGHNDGHNVNNDGHIVLKKSAKRCEETRGMLQARMLCRVMGYVVLLYYVTWLPFLGFNFYSLLTRSKEYNSKMSVIVGTFSLAAPILNPLLYIKMLPRYRKGVSHLLRKFVCVRSRRRPVIIAHGMKNTQTV